MVSSLVTDEMVQVRPYVPPLAVAFCQDPDVPQRAENGAATDDMEKVAVVVTDRPVVGSVPLLAPSTTMPSRHEAELHESEDPPDTSRVAENPLDAGSDGPKPHSSRFIPTVTDVRAVVFGATVVVERGFTVVRVVPEPASVWSSAAMVVTVEATVGAANVQISDVEDK